jgi:hypothetical protein
MNEELIEKVFFGAWWRDTRKDGTAVSQAVPDQTTDCKPYPSPDEERSVGDHEPDLIPGYDHPASYTVVQEYVVAVDPKSGKKCWRLLPKGRMLGPFVENGLPVEFGPFALPIGAMATLSVPSNHVDE